MYSVNGKFRKTMTFPLVFLLTLPGATVISYHDQTWNQNKTVATASNVLDHNTPSTIINTAKNHSDKKTVNITASLAQHEKDTGCHVNWPNFQVVS
jgi:hypothetical protein